MPVAQQRQTRQSGVVSGEKRAQQGATLRGHVGRFRGFPKGRNQEERTIQMVRADHGADNLIPLELALKLQTRLELHAKDLQFAVLKTNVL
ncbi:hypothetical protein TRIUR3_27955 [Triticum urartu]|uniref:Uncharacterized protein n=1 Tax=Triticum urartu TaxID=4572 RepID=M7ZZW6_TRIUA|nr:hypothetical protein TRIUR3_27955 [Triticum urartu]